MKTRWTFVILLALLLPACGGPSSDSADRAGESVGAQRQTRPAKRLVENRLPPAKNPGADSAQPPAESQPAGEAAGAARNWTGRDGRLLASGELIDLIGNKVCLQGPDGEGVVILLDQLCETDQQYVSARVGGTTVEPVQEDQQSGSSTPPEAPSRDEDPPPDRGTPRRPIPRSEWIVIPFDFVSKFDNGRYGEMVGEMIWKKLQREGGFIIPETMVDVRDTCQSHNIHPAPETTLAQMKKHVEDDFGAHVGIWGSVERVAGHEWDVYDLVFKCVNFSAYPEPQVIYEKTARTNTVSEIPHLYVQQILDALYQPEPDRPPPPDPLAEKNWQEDPNLVVGDFQQGTAGVPHGWESHWEAGDVNQREPLGRTIRWIPEAGNPANRVIRFTFDAGVGDSTGVAYYGKLFPIEEGARYRFQCRWRSNGPAAKVFIKCYDQLGTTYRRESQRPGASPGGPGGYVPELNQVREVYRSQQNLKGPKNAWNTQTEDFTPKHTRYTPRWGRVMLYAYLGAGVVEFDDVVLKQIIPPSPGAGHKAPRHSLETKVTIEEMQENERRSREGEEGGEQ